MHGATTLSQNTDEHVPQLLGRVSQYAIPCTPDGLLHRLPRDQLSKVLVIDLDETLIAYDFLWR